MTPEKRRTEIENKREQLDYSAQTPEIAVIARFAQQFGHVVLRHAQNEISTEDHDRFRELYIDKAMKHTLIVDRTTMERDFDVWVEAMLPAAQADIYDVLAEQETGVLPEFVSPAKMSEMMVSADSKLMHKNLELTSENARLMNQVVGMSKERRDLLAKLRRLQDDYDDLRLRAGLVGSEALTDR
jgi:hypothetical protein